MSKVSKALQAAGYSHLESLTEENGEQRVSPEHTIHRHGEITKNCSFPGAPGQLTEPGDLVHTGLGIHIHVADPLAVAHHWDPLGSFLDVSDQLGGAARNDQIYYFVKAAEILNFFSGIHLKREKTKEEDGIFWLHKI